MLALILVQLIAAASPSPPPIQLAQADAPKSRRVCRDAPVSYSRMTRRICTVVEDKPLAAAPAEASPPPSAPLVTALSVGMAVIDVSGSAVGTITALAADAVTVRTDKHEATLPRTSLAISDGKALFGMTQIQLNASIERTLAAHANAALNVGAAVKGKDGASVGTIDAVDAANVTIRLANGQRISIPRSGIAIDAAGTGTIGITAAELEAQVKAAQPGH